MDNSASSGAQFVPNGIPIVCWNSRPPNQLRMEDNLFVLRRSKIIAM